MSARGRWYAAIDPASPRHAAWVQVLGADVVEIESPDQVEAWNVDDDGVDRLGAFYKVRVEGLSFAAIGRLVSHLARLWGLPEREVCEELAGEHGLPILAADVAIGSTPAAARAAIARSGEVAP